MATGGVLGNGTKVGYSSSSPVTYTRITQVLEVTFPTMAPDKVDKTTHGSSKYKKNFPGMIEVGDLVVRVLADHDQATTTDHRALWDLRDNQTEVWWGIEIPTNRAQSRWKLFEFYGYVGDITNGTPIDDKQTIEFTIVHSGEGIGSPNASGSSVIT